MRLRHYKRRGGARVRIDPHQVCWQAGSRDRDIRPSVTAASRHHGIVDRDEVIEIERDVRQIPARDLEMESSIAKIDSLD